MGRETLGGRIERIRDLAGLKARELDRLAGLHEGHVRSIETGSIGGEISARTLSQIADVFGVSLDWLFDGSGSKPDEAAILARAPRLQAAAKRQKTGTSD